MKKRIISLVLALVLCVTLFSPMASASTIVENKTVLVGTISVAIATNGDLYCWGRNALGQVGVGENEWVQPIPMKVLSNVSSVTTCNSNVAAITTNSDLYCWGSNKYGQVGNGKLEGKQTTPVKVMSNVESVTMYDDTIAVIAKNGDLYIWGKNIYGQIGNGKIGVDAYQSTPVKVLSNVASVKMNEGTVAAIATNGNLYTWGNNEYGQVGNGKIGTDACQITPVKVLSNVASLTSNDGPIAAITTSGDLYCWGKNWFGQVGNGNRTHQTTPVKVLSKVISVSTSSTTIAITTNGDLYGWGYTEIGQVGNGKFGREDSQTTPVKVLSNVASVTSSITNTAAITNSGDLYCWGSNGHGQIGNGARADQATPVKVLSNVSSFITYQGVNAGALTKNGDLYCWGLNNVGQVGNGTSGLTEDPLDDGKVETSPVKVLSNIARFTMNDYVVGAVDKNSNLYCWGSNQNGEIGNGTGGIGLRQSTPVKVFSGVRMPNAVPSALEITATPTASKVLVNGKVVSFEAYTINGNNYFKLRDLAKVLSGTDKQFDVSWDNENKRINLLSSEVYSNVGGELVKGDGIRKIAVPNESSIYKDGVLIVNLKAYTINGNNFFKLRDLTQEFNIGVGYDNVTQVITIDTKLDYVVPGEPVV